MQFCLMNLIIDQGNTSTKTALFENGKILEKVVYLKSDHVHLEEWVEKQIQDDTPVLLCSVTNQDIQINSSRILSFNHDTPLPIGNSYSTPETLGKDRIANAVAIWSKSHGQNAICIDLGTCIKYDLVVDQKYVGGNISPGLMMRFRALNSFTDQLPQIQPQIDFIENDSDGYGISTESSILNGVQQAIIHEINGFISRYQRELGPLTIFMTGGDAKFFDKALKKGIFAVSINYWENLTLFGLNEILEYNVKA